MSDIRRIATISLASAKSCLTQGNYGRAFANLLLFLKLAPERRNDVRMEFALATREWTESLERDGRTDILFKCYDQACEMFPDHDIVLNNIGAQLFRLGYTEEAAAYIRKSLLVNPEYLAARENLENICSHLVERWHFRMLNDTARNHAFSKAILTAVGEGYDRVLDIGTGTGILSLMCIQSKAEEVYACERSLAMYEVAQDVLQANNADSKISLLHKSSINITIPDDIPERVNLVVTETFDAGLFGEHVVSTLCHAWKELITNIPGQVGRVIPGSASVYVCGVECDAIREQTRLLYPVVQELDLSRFEFLCNTGNIAEDPYTTENLSRVKGGYHVVTDVAKLLTVNFCSPQELERMNRGIDWVTELVVKQSGRLDALAVWFDLHLIKDVTITTRPEQENCWEQAIFPVFSLTRSQNSTEQAHESSFVRKGSTLTATFHFAKDCLRLMKCQVTTQQKSAEKVLVMPSNSAAISHVEEQSQLNGCTNPEEEQNKLCYQLSGSVQSRNVEAFKCERDTPLSLDALQLHRKVCDTVISDCVESRALSGVPRISENQRGMQLDSCSGDVDETSSRQLCLLDQMDIKFMNDIQLNSIYCHVLQRFCKNHPNKQPSMLQISRAPCLVGVQATKMNFSHVTIVTPENNHDTYHQVAEMNGCQKEALCLREPTDVERLNVKADLILCELVEPCGALRQQVLEDLALLKATCLSEGGVIVPAEVLVHGIFIQSRELENVSLVTGNDKTLGFNIANYINVFQSQNHVDIELATLPHTKLSEAFQLLHLKLNELPLDGSLLSQFLQQSHKIRVPVIDSGQVTALVYWFEMRLYEDIKVLTIDSRTHWKQAAIMIKGENCVLPGETLRAHVTLQNTCLDVKLEEIPNPWSSSGTSAIIVGV